MARVLLVNPPLSYPKGSKDPAIYLPIGLLSVAAYLIERGHDPDLLDTLFLEGPRLEEEGDGFRIGASWEAVRRELEKRRGEIDLVGITNLFTAQVKGAFRAAELAKEVMPGIPVVLGGSPASADPEWIFSRCEAIDACVVGEGEETAAALASAAGAAAGAAAPLDGIEHLALRGKGTTAGHIDHLDSLPPPAYDLVEMEGYIDSSAYERLFGRRPLGRRKIPIVTTRGCPYSCTFCSIHVQMGRRFRAFSAEYVVSLIEELTGRYGIDLLWIEDDNFSLDTERLEEILDGIMKRGIRIEWEARNGLRADTLTRPLIERMKRAGCVRLAVAPETGSQDVLDRIVKKRMNLDDVTRVAADCRDLGVPLRAFFVIGMPGETRRDIERTIDYAYRLRRDYGVESTVSIATPLPGTEMLRTAVERGYLAAPIDPESYIRATNSKGMIRTEEFTPESIAAYQRIFYRKVFLAGAERDGRFLAALSHRLRLAGERMRLS